MRCLSVRHRAGRALAEQTDAFADFRPAALTGLKLAHSSVHIEKGSPRANVPAGREVYHR